ncbi:hypothetical protein OS493_007438 [Desmophyllum pertusum]|uniref:Uncharacterized protein n=1 Tax=Desmophyllum pertusum TaxID=174260 RepID=A0A9W9YS35_9CNID|nr:hypothetical protein OS493_011583 [Desmophyllum pertusum]KAJ7374349.1 hypothetical protein OS493_007438 [Desmophyllum pertusum]
MLPVQFNSSTVHPTTKAPEALSVESDSESDDSKGNSKKTKESRKTKEDKARRYVAYREQRNAVDSRFILGVQVFISASIFTLDHTRLTQEGIDDETNSQWKKPVEDASEKAVGSNNLTSNAGDNNLAPVELDKLSVGQYVALDKAEWSNRPLIEHVENTAPIP